MSFGEKIKMMRKKCGLSQEELAEKIGVSRRSLIYYEQDKSFPSRPEVITALADAFGVSTDELYSDGGALGSVRQNKSAQEIIDGMCALFAGGELSNDDKEEALQIVTEAYWRAKEKNRRFAPRRFNGMQDD